jgi:hypothetical protein
MKAWLYFIGNIPFFNRGVSYMVLIGILNSIKNILDQKKLDKKEFVEQLINGMMRASKLFRYINSIETFDEMVSLIAFHISNGDMDLATLVSHLIFTYVDITKDLDEENRMHLRELIAFYLQK